MGHSKKKRDQTPLGDQDVMGSEDDFAPGGSDGARAQGAAFEGSSETDGPESAPAGTDTSEPDRAGPGVDDLATERDKYLRLAAEYDNYRKRSAKERSDAGTRAQADLVRQLVEALDDVARFAHIDPATTDATTVVQGVDMVEKK
ncbi:MAG TPA: nucleotide exchange factor GrpE, partial [Gemmatimonadaceae bacterium]